MVQVTPLSRLVFVTLYHVMLVKIVKRLPVVYSGLMYIVHVFGIFCILRTFNRIRFLVLL